MYSLEKSVKTPLSNRRRSYHILHIKIVQLTLFSLFACKRHSKFHFGLLDEKETIFASLTKITFPKISGQTPLKSTHKVCNILETIISGISGLMKYMYCVSLQSLQSFAPRL